MRRVMNQQMELGEVRIESLDPEPKSRDDIPAVLRGLQHLYVDDETRARLFSLLEAEAVPGVDQTGGRPGMDLWRILVMAIFKQGLGIDFDRLHHHVNYDQQVRQFLCHGSLSDSDHYEMETVVRNVNLPGPELLSKVGHLVVESGHRISKKFGERLCGQCDSFVVETDVHYPTDTNLLWDSMRCLIRETARAAQQHEVGGWRQWKHLRDRVKDAFNRIRRQRQANAAPSRVEDYLCICEGLVKRAEQTLWQLSGQPGPELVRSCAGIQHCIKHARRQLDQVERRLIKGEVMPHAEKVFSIFEPHTRWISKGKAGRPVELGVPVCVVEDNYGFILQHEIMWEGGDGDIAVSIIKGAQKKYPDLGLCSFDRGFHSPQNRIRLDALLDDNVLPRKGRWSKSGRERETPDASIRRLNRRSTILNIAVLTGCVPTARMGLPVWWRCRWSRSTCIVLVWSCAGRSGRSCGARNGAALPDDTLLPFGISTLPRSGDGNLCTHHENPSFRLLAHPQNAPKNGPIDINPTLKTST